MLCRVLYELEKSLPMALNFTKGQILPPPPHTEHSISSLWRLQSLLHFHIGIFYMFKFSFYFSDEDCVTSLDNLLKNGNLSDCNDCLPACVWVSTLLDYPQLRLLLDYPHILKYTERITMDELSLAIPHNFGCLSRLKHPLFIWFFKHKKNSLGLLVQVTLTKVKKIGTVSTISEYPMENLGQTAPFLAMVTVSQFFNCSFDYFYAIQWRNLFMLGLILDLFLKNCEIPETTVSTQFPTSCFH